jgi:hypothetical protein
MDYVIAICSHNRADKIEKQTLGLLERLGVRDKAVLFVAPEQRPQYERFKVRMEVGELGMAQNRNRLVTFFPNGTKVLSLDDDLNSISIRFGDDLRVITPKEFDGMIEKGFSALEPWKAAMWGISPNHNDRFKTPDFQVGAPSVEGPLFGFVAGRGDLRVPIETRYEDVERVCRLFDAGWNVVRLGSYVHHQSTAKGGGRTDRVSGCVDVRRLERKYPHLVEHRFGKLASADPCRPALRSKRWINNPKTLNEVTDMRERIKYEKFRIIPNKIHQWFTDSTEDLARIAEIEEAAVNLRVLLNKNPTYGRGDEAIDDLREACAKHHRLRQSKRVFKEIDAPAGA